jgi:hypothetical protein
MNKEPLLDDFIDLDFSGDRVPKSTGNQTDYGKGLMFDDDDFESLEARASRAKYEGEEDDEETDDDEVKTGSKEDADDEESKSQQTKGHKDESSKSDKAPEDDDTDEDDEESEDDDYVVSEGVEAEIPSLLKFLQSQKVLDLPEGFKPEHSLDSFVEAMEYNLEQLQTKARDSFLSSLPEEVVSLVKFTIANKGATIDDYIEEYNNSIGNVAGGIDLTNADLEDEDQQRKIYKYYLKATTKYSDDKINKQIDLLEKNSELYFEAKEALTELITMEAEAKKQFDKQQTELMNDRLKKEKEERQNYINTIKSNENIPTERKQKVQNFIINKVTLSNGMQVNGLVKALNELGKNPEHVVQLADILLDYDPNKGLDLNRFVALGKSQKTKEIKKQLDDTTRDRKIGGRRGSRATKGFDWEK